MKRFRKTKSGYLIDKYLFISSMIIIFSILFSLMYAQGFNFTPNFYIKCEHYQGCPNPFYGDNTYKQKLTILFVIPLHTTKDARERCTADWCDKETIPMGEYGNPPPILMKYILLLSFVILLLSILLNHLIHNKGKKFDLGILEFWKAELKKLGIDTDKIKMPEFDEDE